MSLIAKIFDFHFQTAAEWQLVFWITAFIYAFGVVFFFLTVSGDKQPWNDQHLQNVPNEAEPGEETEENSLTVSPNNSQAKLTDVRKLSSPPDKKKSPQDSQKSETGDGGDKSPKLGSSSPKDTIDTSQQKDGSSSPKESGSSPKEGSPRDEGETNTQQQPADETDSKKNI